ncbi:MAG: sporulation-delaying protein SdpB family protein [Daejeonella sp.]
MNNKAIINILNLTKWYDFNHISISIARSCLALGSIITLLFNSPILLFSPTSNTNPSHVFDLTKISIFYISYPNYLYVAIIVSIIILLSVIIGIYPRITCFFQWWISYSIFNSSYVIEGGDQITSILTLLLIPICLTDNRINHWKYKTQSKRLDFLYYNAVFAYWIIRLQMAILYLNASISKLKVNEWVNGTALYYWFTEPNFGMPNYLYPLIMPLIEDRLILPIFTWSVILCEFFLFLAFNFNNNWRRRWLVIGILFHLGIFVIHGLFSFFLAMTGGLILYLHSIKKKENV